MSDNSSSPGGQVQTITGMRGGLGRTLLSAFLLLTIVPLAAISFLAVNWARRDLRQEVAAKLAAVVRQKEAEINTWTTALTIQLDALADNPANQRVFLDPLSAEIRDVEAESLARRTLQAARNASTFGEIGLLDADGQVLVATDSQRFAGFPRLVPSLVPSCLTDPVLAQSLILAWCAVQDDEGVTQGYLVGLADLGTLDAIMTRQTNLGETGETYLVSPQAVPLTALRFAVGGSVL